MQIKIQESNPPPQPKFHKSIDNEPISPPKLRKNQSESRTLKNLIKKKKEKEMRFNLWGQQELGEGEGEHSNPRHHTHLFFSSSS